MDEIKTDVAAGETTENVEAATREENAGAKAENAETVKDESTAEILDELSKIEERLGNLETIFKEKIAHSEYEEKTMDRMHDELQDYKQDLYFKIMRPIINEVISIRASILRNSQGKDDEDTIPIKLYKTYAYDMQDALENCNVELFADKEGDKFDPTTMHVVKKVSTPAPELDGIIASVVSEGYRYEGKLLARENVEVYAFSPSKGI